MRHGSAPAPSWHRPTRCRSTTSCGRSPRSNRSCCGSSCWYRTSSSGSSTNSGPDQLPSTVARELFRAIALQREPSDEGVHPPFSWEGLLLGLDPEVRGLAQALVALDRPRPEDRELERLLIDIEQIRLRDRHDYNESALAEAEREHDNPAIERLMLEKIQINEQRLSLDRRRDQTRLLAVHRR